MEKYVTVKALADAWGVSHQHVYNLIWQGQIKFIRVGRAYRIPTQVLKRGV